MLYFPVCKNCWIVVYFFALKLVNIRSLKNSSRFFEKFLEGEIENYQTFRWILRDFQHFRVISILLHSLETVTLVIFVLDVYWMCTGCVLDVYWMCIGYVLDVYWIFKD